MSASPDRVLCPRCGVNNFATQAACWKCGASLSAIPAAATARPASPSPAGASLPDRAPAQTVDPALANWSAGALAFLFPFVAVPVGLVFLMLDDRRKAQLGKITLVWGTIFSILHFLVMGWFMAESINQVRAVLPPQMGGRTQPLSPSTPVPQLELPGIPR